MTASTLYEAVEPHIIWKQLLTSIFMEITGDGMHFGVRNKFLYPPNLELTLIQAIRMVLFILKTFSQDEEIQTIHLPIVFSAIMDIVDVC